MANMTLCPPGSDVLPAFKNCHFIPISATRLVILCQDVSSSGKEMQLFWNLLCRSVVRSADTRRCIRAGQYHDYCYSSQSLKADLQSLLLPLFLFMKEAGIGSWWDLQDLFFIIDLFQSLSNCFFPFLKYTCSFKNKSKAEVLFLNGFLHLFLF